jgi:hypothetical protein
MDLGGASYFHISKLQFTNEYNKTLSLNANLWVDVLDMTSGATIDGGTSKDFSITQETTSTVRPVATQFGTSYWKEGTIKASAVNIYGDGTHQALLKLAPNTNAGVFLSANMNISKDSAVEWSGANVEVLKDKTITNKGTFTAKADPGKMIQTKPGTADRWKFVNEKGADWVQIEGKFDRCDPTQRGNMPKRASLAGPGLFEIVGNFTQDDQDATAVVEAGTLVVTGTWNQTAGSVTLIPATTLQVTDTYTLSGGTVSVPGTSTLLSAGTLSQTGGTFTVTNGAELVATNTVTVSGGTFVLSDGGWVESASGFTIQSGGILNGIGEITINTGALVNAGIISVGGPSALGTMHVTGNYTQTGTLNIEMASSSNFDRLQITGLATLGGTLNVTKMGTFSPGPGSSFSIITFGSYTGAFNTVNLFGLSFGVWHTTYNSNNFTIWVGYW